MLSTELMKQQVIPLFFSPKGRISRGLFWKSNFVLLLGFFTLICLLMAIEQIFSLTNNERILDILIAVILSYLYASIVLMVKRLHDINWSGWLAIISILTPLGYIVGLMPSQSGRNAHGENLIEYEKKRLYINRGTGLPPPPPPIDNPISKIILCLMMVLPIPSFVVAGMVIPKSVEKPAMEPVEEVTSSEQAEEKVIQNKSTLQSIETLVDNKVAESIKFLNEESRRSASDDDYYKYALNSKNIIRSDLNQDGKMDYVVEASFCEETNCHSTTMTYEVFIFTTDQQDQINFITDLNLDLDAKVTNITIDGIMTIENHEYAEDDPSCCPSIVNTQSYALVGKKLALLTTPE